MEKIEDTSVYFKDTGCKFDPIGVICKFKNTCGSCGWNPTVAERRKAKIRESRQGMQNGLDG